jgi:hypothetical protein
MRIVEREYETLSEKVGKISFNAKEKESAGYADKVYNIALIIGAVFVLSIFFRALMW